MLRSIVIPVYIVLLLVSIVTTSTFIDYINIKKDKCSMTKVLVLICSALDILIVLEICIFTFIAPIFNELIVYTILSVLLGIVVYLTFSEKEDVCSF